MSQHELDLGTLQELISPPSRHKIRACQQKLSGDGRIAIGSVETDQSHLWGESEVLQIGRDRSERRGQFIAIVAIALARIRTNPLARVHLKRGGPCADHFPTLAPPVARRTDRRPVGVWLQAR